MSIHFICPHCGMTSDVEDLYAGQSVACVSCKKPITYPWSEGARPLSPIAEQPEPKPRHRFTVVHLLAVITIIGFLIATMLPARSVARETIRWRECVKNLKLIGTAIQAYHDTYHSFPPAYIPDRNGKPARSWRVLLLPFMNEQKLYAEYRFDEPWDGTHNMALASRMPKCYRCPSEGELGEKQITSYAMIVGPHAVSDGPHVREDAEFAHGKSQTIVVAEAAGAGIKWLEPRDLEVEKMTFAITHPSYFKEPQPAIVDISSCHWNVANVLFCDGSVRRVPSDLAPSILKALMDVDGKQSVLLGDREP